MVSICISVARIRCQQAVEVRGRAQLDTDQRLAGLPVVALDVLEQRDVVVGSQHAVEEPAQRPGLLREVDQEIVLETQVHQRALQHLAIPGHVVVAAGDQAHHGAARLDVGFQQTGDRQRAGGLGDDALVLIQVEHRGAHRALVDRGDRHHVAGGGQRRVSQLSRPWPPPRRRRTGRHGPGSPAPRWPARPSSPRRRRARYPAPRCCSSARRGRW